MARGMMRHGAYTHSWQRGCAVLLLLVATAAVAAGQETDTAVTSADSQAAADAACADLSAVHIPDPAGRRDVYYVSGLGIPPSGADQSACRLQRSCQLP